MAWEYPFYWSTLSNMSQPRLIAHACNSKSHLAHIWPCGNTPLHFPIIQVAILGKILKTAISRTNGANSFVIPINHRCENRILLNWQCPYVWKQRNIFYQFQNREDCFFMVQNHTFFKDSGFVNHNNFIHIAEILESFCRLCCLYLEFVAFSCFRLKLEEAAKRELLHEFSGSK